MKKTKYAGKYPPAKEYRANADEKETALPKQFQRAFVEENLSKWIRQIYANQMTDNKAVSDVPFYRKKSLKILNKG